MLSVDQEIKKRVIVDEREKPSGVPDLLRNLDVEVELHMLDIGDYVISPECCIERKEKGDFIQSLYSGRLFDQINRMSKVYPRPILIVEGKVSKKDNSFNLRVFWGALASMILGYNLNVLFTDNTKQTADLILALTKHANPLGKPKKAPLFRRNPKTKDLVKTQLTLVSSLPGIGSKLADKILKEFLNIRTIFSGSVAQFSLVDGIGRAKAERIVEILDSPYPHNEKFPQQLHLNEAKMF